MGDEYFKQKIEAVVCTKNQYRFTLLAMLLFA